MLQAFRAFLKSEYSEENLDFWLDCQDYRQQKPNRRKKAAARIYATYLDSQAPKEVRLLYIIDISHPIYIRNTYASIANNETQIA